MTILFNIRLFILRMLPTALRTDRMLDWIESLFTHGANIMLRLHLLRNATRYEISLNGTVIAMERALNDLFDPILRRIYIEDASTRENPTFWFDNEGQENPTMWFDNEGQTLLTMWLDDELNANTHFIVYVPNGLGYNAAQMASLINRLRFAGRVHAVQGYNWATAPSNTTAPVVSGSTTIGSTLTTTDGSWNGTAPFTYTYQWRRNGTAISGATSSTYVVALADVSTTITCLVTATNVAGSASQASNGIAIPALWTPASLTRYFDYDMNAIAGADGSNPASIADASSSGRNLAVGLNGNATLRTNVLNGKSVLEMVATSMYELVSASAAPNQPVTYLLVARQTTHGTTNRVVRHGAGDGFLLYVPSSGSVTPFAGANGPAAAVGLNNWGLMFFEINGASSRTKLNGGTASTGNAGTSIPNNASIRLGDGQQNGQGFRGQIARIMMVTGTLTTQNIERLEGWAAHEYGLTASLPANHPFKTNPPQV